MKTILANNPGGQGEGETSMSGNATVSNQEGSRKPWLTLWDEIAPARQPQGRAATLTASKTGK
jgi:hypothetical protein